MTAPATAPRTRKVSRGMGRLGIKPRPRPSPHVSRGTALTLHRRWGPFKLEVGFGANFHETQCCRPRVRARRLLFAAERAVLLLPQQAHLSAGRSGAPCGRLDR